MSENVQDLHKAFLRVLGRKPSISRHQAKDKLKALGWSYRRVAPVLGVRHEHLSHVLNGHRQSRRLLTAINTLSPAPTTRNPKKQRPQ